MKNDVFSNITILEHNISVTIIYYIGVQVPTNRTSQKSVREFRIRNIQATQHEIGHRISPYIVHYITTLTYPSKYVFLTVVSHRTYTVTHHLCKYESIYRK